MQELNSKKNKLGLKVFINGTPNLNLAPKEELDSFISLLEPKIVEHYKEENKAKDKNS